MKKLLAIPMIWLLCSAYTWGTLMADSDWANVNWYHSNFHARDDVGIIFAVCLLGPVGLIVAVVTSNFNQHGWELWEKPR